MLKTSIPFILSLSVVLLKIATAEQLDAPVQLTVYYEALCPDSRYFITQPLHNTLQSLPGVLNIKYIPFGKASSNGYGNFDCQHGPDECRGNIVQSCALARLTPGKAQHDFVYCSMRNPRQYERCVSQSGLSWTDVDACSESPEGYELQRANEVLTKGNTDGPTFVPSIAVNNVFDKSASTEAYGNLGAFLCKNYLPNNPGCQQKYYF